MQIKQLSIDLFEEKKKEMVHIATKGWRHSCNPHSCNSAEEVVIQTEHKH